MTLDQFKVKYGTEGIQTFFRTLASRINLSQFALKEVETICKDLDQLFGHVKKEGNSWSVAESLFESNLSKIDSEDLESILNKRGGGDQSELRIRIYEALMFLKGFKKESVEKDPLLSSIFEELKKKEGKMNTVAQQLFTVADEIRQTTKNPTKEDPIRNDDERRGGGPEKGKGGRPKTKIDTDDSYIDDEPVDVDGW